MPEETRVGEEMVIADVTVRFIEADTGGGPHIYAAGSPLSEEWCYLADSASLEELEIAVRVVLEDKAARDVFVRMAALLGVEWNEGDMVALLYEQELGARRLYAEAPDTAEADPEELRRMRRAAAEDVAEHD